MLYVLFVFLYSIVYVYVSRVVWGIIIYFFQGYIWVYFPLFLYFCVHQAECPEGGAVEQDVGDLLVRVKYSSKNQGELLQLSSFQKQTHCFSL